MKIIDYLSASNGLIVGLRKTHDDENAPNAGGIAWPAPPVDRIPDEIDAPGRSMTQVIVYFSVNAGLLAIFAGLWALGRKPKARQPAPR